MPSPRLFTPTEANKMLPLVKQIVGDVLKTGQTIRLISVEMDKPEEDAEVNRLMDLLDDLFDELEELGCSYRDWNFMEGLVDFPAIIHGREVMLCWRSDETKVSYFHDRESGYSGRQPIPMELLG